MAKTVTVKITPPPNRGYVGWQFPNQFGGPVRIPYPNANQVNQPGTR